MFSDVYSATEPYVVELFRIYFGSRIGPVHRPGRPMRRACNQIDSCFGETIPATTGKPYGSDGATNTLTAFVRSAASRAIVHRCPPADANRAAQ